MTTGFGLNKSFGSLSLDLDNKWSYLKTHGDPAWESFPSYLDLVVPRILEILKTLDLKITVFVVGQDAALEKNREAIRQIAAAGHEIGNHTFHHEPWLHLYTPQQLEEEFERSEAAIEAVTGKRTVGFRGPGFSLSDEVLRVLIRRGYEYDCSIFPTYLGPLARSYCFFKSKLSREQKADRKDLFGGWADGFQSNKPFSWVLNDQKLVEVPVTTMPIFKVPIHATYLHYLGGFSPALAKAYFWQALKLCRWVGVEPSFLLHPLDFLGSDDEQEMDFFPGMNQPVGRKLDLLTSCLQQFQEEFEVIPIRKYVGQLNLPKRNRCVSKAVTGVSGELAKLSS